MNSTSHQKFAGKVALVTGGSRGIVAVTYSSSPVKAEEVVKEIKDNGGSALAIQADSADAAAVRASIELTVRTFGGIDVLVNNAGLGLMGTVDQFTLEDFDRIVAVNLRSVFVATQAAAAHMGEGGRIINIGSCLATKVPFTGVSAYAMTKAGVAALTQGLSRDLGLRGITVNNVQPGPIDTDMNPADGPGAETMRGLTALGRRGQAHEIAGMVSYLAGPEAGFVTGTSLTIDGGTNA